MNTPTPRNNAPQNSKPAYREISPLHRIRFRVPPQVSKAGISIAAILGSFVIWHIAASHTSPLFLPSPLQVARAAVEMIGDGSLIESIIASTLRIMAGWAAGVAIGVPLGLFMGRFIFVRLLADPFIEFFRFIPPIAFVTLAVIWLGPGELTKVALIFYTSVFIVTLNTIAGVEAVNPQRLQAARSLGANKWQEMTTVIVPSTVPFMVTGARIAMGNSFLTVVSAEIVAAQSGLGAMIWSARNYARTDWVFVGIIALGWLGFIIDRLMRVATRKALQRYL